MEAFRDAQNFAIQPIHENYRLHPFEFKINYIISAC
jgi:hypothetical protein